MEVVALLTTFTEGFDRVAMHGTRRALVEAQAKAAGIPLLSAFLPWPCSNEEYEAIMADMVEIMKTRYQPSHVAFGDLFLEDIRDYRERQMAGTGLDLLFPLWGENTADLAASMIDSGLRATLTCVDPKQLAPDFVGRAFDHELLAELPPRVDPCGENGEFHSFVHQGPMFSQSLDVCVGETVERDGFAFADIDFASIGKRTGTD